MEILSPDESPAVHRYSSIDQFKGYFVTTYERGGWVPIMFDSLDGITCEKVHSHRIAITGEGDIGYQYSDGECVYASDMYMYFDQQEKVLKPLPCYMGGEGEFYEPFRKSNSFLNGDDVSLGIHSTKRYRVGLSYVKADEFLPAVD